MRWFWIDRFTHFQVGVRAGAIKNVSLAEEPLDDYMPGRPSLPQALVVEGTAQTGGLLVGACTEFHKRVVLAKVGKAIFHRPGEPGDQIRFEVAIEDMRDDGAIVSGATFIDEKPQAELELTFAFLDSRFGTRPLFPTGDLMRMLRILKLFEVAVDANNQPWPIPVSLLAGERDLSQ